MLITTPTRRFVPAASGDGVFLTAGTFSFVVPLGVTSICAVAVGGGGAGSPGAGGIGGAGGSLAYANSIATTPGETLTVFVGVGATAGGSSPGGDSAIRRGASTFLLYAVGGLTASSAQQNITSNIGTSSRGGRGGEIINARGAGGGGAGGYVGAGGNGGAGGGLTLAGPGNNTGDQAFPTTRTAYGGAPATSSGAGAGGDAQSSTATVRGGGGGGGTGMYGLGADGLASQVGNGNGGGGGSTFSSTGTNGSDYTLFAAGLANGGDGGFPGGGGGGTNNTGPSPGAGGGGAVRIIWGAGKSFPNNAV